MQYTYDSYARLTQVQRGTLSNGQFTANSCQQENYYYDTNPFNANYSQYALGHLTAVQYYGGQYGNSGPGSCDTTFQELYSYGIAGGYFRDAETGNDYADQRYHLPGQGRFMSPDRMTGRPNNRGSWNKYAYAGVTQLIPMTPPDYLRSARLGVTPTRRALAASRRQSPRG